MSPSLTLYRVNGSCALVPHCILTQYAIPFHGVPMEPTPDSSFGSRYRATDGSLSHEEYLRINPTGYVPCIVVQPDHNDGDDGASGTAIGEMPAVLTYIASLLPEKNLLGRTDAQRAKAYEWLCWLSGTLHSLGFAAFWRPERFVVGEEAKKEVSVRGREVIDKCYARIEAALNGREFAVGEGLTVVDFNLYVFWRWGRLIDVDMERHYPSYGRLMRVVEGLEGVRKAVQVEGKQLYFEE
ncbi:glutathione s-transferase [Colletotrichum truncatum]|uniref:Glutathione s-transferase n=1 Tax=Colletotrichum truncatum TaxID=5467 RepID=A0ACC3ZKM9_COLTU|nr:glutathione s-transferase [Colletotrichum truncatum]KAF6800074.1 glutathione s-transferase [Colletotrichum truncatum]